MRSPARFAVALVTGVVVFAGIPRRAEPLPLVPAYFQGHTIATGLDWPIGLAFLPDGRLMFIECKSARVRMLVGGAMATTDPLGTVDSVAAASEEQGLWGLAIDPRWPVKPYIYVMYGALDSTLRVSRLTLAGALSDSTSGNLAVVPGSRRDLIRDVLDLHPEHNGGCLRFRPDSMLYASFGDDMYGCQATFPSQLYGVIARLDVRRLPDTPGPPDKALLVPVDNPFVNSPYMNERLAYARGFRNPFRFSIDRPTGRLFVGDVGWESFEELDMLNAPGLNLGWPFFEGPQAYVTTNECGTPVPGDLRSPIYYYSRTQWCPYPNPLYCEAAVVGGIVIRSVDTPVSFPPSYDGQYLFSDYYEGFVWRLRDSLGTWVKAPAEVGQPNARDWGRVFTQVSDYVQARDGSLYYTVNAQDYASESGEIDRVTYHAPSVDVPRSRASIATFAAVFPSPVRGSATLDYVLARPASVRLGVFDALGRRVRQLVPETTQTASEYRVHWDGRDEAGRAVPPGVYVARLTVDGEALDRRVPVLR